MAHPFAGGTLHVREERSTILIRPGELTTTAPGAGPVRRRTPGVVAVAILVVPAEESAISTARVITAIRVSATAITK
jgi:hypothetical protein